MPPRTAGFTLPRRSDASAASPLVVSPSPGTKRPTAPPRRERVVRRDDDHRDPRGLRAPGEREEEKDGEERPGASRDSGRPVRPPALPWPRARTAEPARRIHISDRPRFLTTGLLRLGLLCAVIVGIGMLPGHLTPHEAGVIALVGLVGLPIAIAIPFLAVVRTFARAGARRGGGAAASSTTSGSSGSGPRSSSSGRSSTSGSGGATRTRRSPGSARGRGSTTSSTRRSRPRSSRRRATSSPTRAARGARR